MAVIFQDPGPLIDWKRILLNAAENACDFAKRLGKATLSQIKKAEKAAYDAGVRAAKERSK